MVCLLTRIHPPFQMKQPQVTLVSTSKKFQNKMQEKHQVFIATSPLDSDIVMDGGRRQLSAQQHALGENNKIRVRLPSYEILFTNGLNVYKNILHEAPQWPRYLSNPGQNHFYKALLEATAWPCSLRVLGRAAAG